VHSNAPISEQTSVHAIISGEVQGVGFRYTTEKVANHLGITGTVRNLPDGTVEIYVTAPLKLLDTFFDMLKIKTSGSVDAIYKEVSLTPIKFDKFKILR